MAKDRAQPSAIPDEQTPIPGGGESKGAPPKFGTQRPGDAKGDLPRLVNPLERFPEESVTRYKVRLTNYHPNNGPRYILAKTGDEAGVKALYLTVSGLDAIFDRFKKNGITNHEAPDFVVTALED